MQATLHGAAPRFATGKAPWYRWGVALYDRLYRYCHGLDRRDSLIGPALRVELRRAPRPLYFADGTTVPAGERICVLHLNNDRIRALHADGVSPVKVGLAFRCQFLASLHALAVLARPGGALSEVRAFEATTIFHRRLHRFGFEAARDHLLWPQLVAIYQRALLTCLHPAGTMRLQGSEYRRAERLWLSRERLLALDVRTPQHTHFDPAVAADGAPSSDSGLELAMGACVGGSACAQARSD